MHELLQMQSALQSLHGAFEMGPKERAVYLRKPVPKGRHAAEQAGEEEAGTLAGTNAAALRAWIRQVSSQHACATLRELQCVVMVDASTCPVYLHMA